MGKGGWDRWLGQVGGQVGRWVEGHERQVGDIRDRWRDRRGTGEQLGG